MNKYEIQGIVGEGAYGIVYKAKNKETGDIRKVKWIYLTSCNKEVQRIRRWWDCEENYV